MIGFRAPLYDDRTIIGILENPARVFEQKTRPIIANKPIYLNLRSGGIRAIIYDAAMEGYLITNKVYGMNDDSSQHSQMLLWDGNKRIVSIT